MLVPRPLSYVPRSRCIEDRTFAYAKFFLIRKSASKITKEDKKE